MPVVGKISQLLVLSPVPVDQLPTLVGLLLGQMATRVLDIAALSPTPFALYLLLSDKLFLCLFDEMPREEVQLIWLICESPALESLVAGGLIPGPVTFGWEAEKDHW